MRKQLILIFLSLLSVGVFAQKQTVTGKVLDSSNEPLIGATVKEVGNATNGTMTNFDGNFTLSVKSGASLEISYVGYSTQRVVSSTTPMTITLKDDASVLNEVVVTGYTTQARSEMTTSISKLDSKVLQSAPRSNVATALQGTVPGLKVTQNTGQPGATPSMTLRGGTSWDGGGSPLILIDGVPSSFFALNAEDVESIEVLKDAASSAIYGARAANGVVIVTTKKGKSGKANINFRAKYTSNQARKDPMTYLGAADYVKFNRMAVKNTQMVQNDPNAFSAFLTGAHSAATGNNTTNSIYTTMYLTPANQYLLNQPGWMKMIDPIDPTKELIFMDNDLSRLFYQTSSAQDYNLSFDGGNDKGTYYLGLGMMNDKGLVYGSKFKRLSATFNGSYKIAENLKISSSVMYANTNFNEPYQSAWDMFHRSAGMAPTTRIYWNNPDGTLSNDYSPATALNFGNPLYYQDKFIRENLEQRLNASAQMDYRFLNDFTFTLRGNHFMINDTKEAFNKAFLQQGSWDNSRSASASYARLMRNQVTALINYRKSFGKHNIAALLGSEYFKENYFTFSAATAKSPTDLIPTMNAGSEASGVPTSSKTSYAISSVFGQVNYDYQYRYLLGLTFRNDGTSRLGNNKYGFFPGISIGWNIHNEVFYKESPLKNIVSKLKPRISYGVNGNIESLSNFGVYGLYGKQGIYNGQTGYANSGLPTLDLRWERSTTLNFGLDLALFNDRINFIGDYFIRNVEDKLAGLTLPLWTGFGSITTNNGTLQNRGLELAINADIIKMQDFKWNLGLTYYSVKNYAKHLPANGVDKNRQGGTEIFDQASGKKIYVGGLQEGERVGNDLITAYVFDGVIHNQTELDEYNSKINSVNFAWNKTKRFLGDSKWKDLNGDGIIDNLDRVVIGRITPKFVGAVTSELAYKNISLFVKGDFAVGHYLANGRRIKGIAQTQGNQNGPIEIRDSWTSQNPNSDIPRFDLVDRQKNHLAAGADTGDMISGSSLYWEKGDYFALREVTLNYTLSGIFIKSLTKNIIKDVRLYVTGGNLAYLTAFKGSSPEESGDGKDLGRFPTPRTFTFGLNITF